MKYDEIMAKIAELSKAVAEKNTATDQDKLTALAKQVQDQSEALAKAQSALAVLEDDGPDVSPLRKGRFSSGGAAGASVQEIIKSGRGLEAGEVTELRKFNDDCVIAAVLLNTTVPQLRMYKEFQAQQGVYKSLAKGLNTATNNQGGNWVPTILSPDITDKVRIDTALLRAIPHQPMTSKTWEQGFNTSALTMTYVSEATGNTLTDIATGQTPTRGKLTLTAKALVLIVWSSYEYDEDSVADSLPNLRNDLIRTCGEGVEDGVLNGDPNALRDADVTSTSPRNAWEGIRAKVLDAATVGAGGTLASSNILSCRGKMGKYGFPPDQVLVVTGPIGLTKLLGLAEVITMDKYGSQATVITGELGKIYGMPIVASGQYRETLDTDGGVSGTGGTTTALHLIHRPSFKLGDRRNITLEMFVYPPGQQRALVVTWRGDFGNVFDEAAETIVGEVNNINT